MYVDFSPRRSGNAVAKRQTASRLTNINSLPARCLLIRVHMNQNSRSEARSAPCRRLRSFAQTASSATRPQPADVSKPQSVPANTREGSPNTAATRSIRSATTSGCSMILVSGSMTPATRIWPSYHRAAHRALWQDSRFRGAAPLGLCAYRGTNKYSRPSPNSSPQAIRIFCPTRRLS